MEDKKLEKETEIVKGSETINEDAWIYDKYITDQNDILKTHAIYNISEDDIEDILDQMLAQNLDTWMEQVGSVLDKDGNLAPGKEYARDFEADNVLFYGESGIGKTSVITHWAKRHGLKIVKKTGSELTADLMQGVAATVDTEMGKRGKYLTIDTFDALMPRDKSKLVVLFIDEFTASAVSARSPLLTLINDHEIPSDADEDDPDESTTKFLPNFLFTIAAANPADATFQGNKPLNNAMLNRFVCCHFVPTHDDVVRWYNNFFKPSIEKLKDRLQNPVTKSDAYGYERRIHELDKVLEMGAAIARDPKVKLHIKDEDRESANDQQTPLLNNRTMTKLVRASRGNKDAFFTNIQRYIGNSSDAEEMLRRALSNYVDADNAANQVFKNKNNSLWDMFVELEEKEGVDN